MTFNPKTGELRTDAGQLIKRLHCPVRVAWADMAPAEAGQPYRTCATCQHPVYDTALHTEQVLLDLLAADPTACLKLHLDQPNLTVTDYGQ